MEKEIIEAPADLEKPQAKSRLVSIVSILRVVAAISEGELTVHELTQVLTSSEFRVYDGNTMIIYWGGFGGLTEPIIGDPLDEHSGYNRRVDIVSELYNAYFWENPDATIRVRPYGPTDVKDILVSKDDGVEIARRLWKFFYPNQEKAIDLSRLAEGAGTARSEEKPGYSTPRLNAVGGYPVAPEGLQVGGGEDKPLGTVERNTLLKLVIGMAIKGYGYDPQAARSTSPGEIATDLENLGIAITDDTVRKWLKEAAITVLPQKPH